MSDQDFLKQILLAMNALSQAMPTQMITIKDLNSVHVFCSDYLAKLTGVSREQLIGRKVWLSHYNNDPNFEKIIIDEDQAIIHSRETKIVFKINKFSTGLIPYLAMKTPLINPENNHVVGILVQGLDLGTTVLPTNILNILQLHKKKINSTDLPKLTKREKEVIFFFMAHLSSQEIAEMLYKISGKPITKSTIDSIFTDQLYLKFNVYNRVALYKKLQSLGFDQRIPKELLSCMSVILDIMQVY